MPRYKPAQRNGMFIPVVFEEQIQPGTFEFALHHLIDDELDLIALDAKFRNDATGASAYDPRIMLKIVLLAYSRGLITSRRIEAACEHNVLFMALSGDAGPGYTHIAKFVRELGPQVSALFTQVLLTCDRLRLIGKAMFAIDGVKLPGNASKERSGTHAELAHRAERLDTAAAKIVALHQAHDEHGGEPLDAQRQARIDELRRQAQATRDFIARHPRRLNRKGQELKANVTDPDSAKMASANGVIQGYAAQAAVDAQRQIIVAADIIGSGCEQAMLMPMIEQAAPWRDAQTLITADAGYFSDDTVQALHDRGIPALIAGNGMRQRDERLAEQDRHKAKGDVLYDKRATPKPIKLFRPEHFSFHDDKTARCPAGKTLTRRTRGRALYGRRIATVEPVFANIRHHKRMSRFTLRGQAKVATQWRLYCLVHNFEKIARRAHQPSRVTSPARRPRTPALTRYLRFRLDRRQPAPRNHRMTDLRIETPPDPTPCFARWVVAQSR